MDDTISLHELRAFAAIARHGSLTRAATACGVQRAAMSKLLAGLKARCGVRLVERSTRRVSLTTAGQVLAERAEELLQLSARALEEVRRDAYEPKGLLRVAAPPELVRVLPAWRSPLLDVLAVHRPGHHRVRRVAALLDALDQDLIVSS
jgi:DNA-binding transcriptional LysR family regulator